MSLVKREVDTLPPRAADAPKVKLVVASCSRTATLGLYQALTILGYRPYHMVEVVGYGGVKHMKVLEQAVVAHHNRFSGVRRLERADFDKLIQGFDTFMELPSYFGTDVIQAYLEDPDVRFLLTEREPAGWARSFNNFVHPFVAMNWTLPSAVLRFFNDELYWFLRLNQVLYWVFTDRTHMGEPGNTEALQKNYVEYIAAVKNLVPAERMCVVKIEDGLGWGQICPFLGQPVPEEPYPEGREHLDLAAVYLGQLQRTAALHMMAVVTPVIGVGAWLLMRREWIPTPAFVGSMFGR